MAKELAKFEKTYAQLSKKAETYTQDGVSRKKKILKLQYGMTEEGCNNLADTIADAQSRGIVGTKLSDYLKDKEVQAAHKLLEKATDKQYEIVEELKQYEPDSEALIKEFQKLAADIDKDLKKRRDSSASKKDIEAMRAAIDKSIADLKKVPKRITQGLGPVHLDPVSKYNSEVKKILAKKPAELGKEARDRLAPEGLRDRNRIKQLNICMAEFKNVKSLCESALAKAEEGDVKGLKDDLKEAAKSKANIDKIAREYQELRKDFPDAIEKSKDKAKILKAIKSMEVMAKEAESKVRGTTMTIKKAGVK